MYSISIFYFTFYLFGGCVLTQRTPLPTGLDCVQLPTSIVNVTLLAVAAVRRRLLQYRLPAGPTAANPPHVAAAAVDR